MEDQEVKKLCVTKLYDVVCEKWCVTKKDGVCDKVVCVYTVIANGSIFIHRACVFLMKQGDHPCGACDGPTKRPQYMRISRLITVT